MDSQQAPWRSLVSIGTLITGLLMVAAWSISYDWITGTFLVLLLYAHEAGHVLAARWRKVPVDQAPLFIPGLGAFVVIGGGMPAWENVLVAAGGPLLGGVAALVAKAVGLRTGNAALAYAGNLALAINLYNLFPLALLDGGRILSATGWLGLVPGLLVAAAGFATGNLLLIVIGLIMAIMVGFRMMKLGGGAPPLRTALGAVAVYLAVGVLLAAAVARSGHVMPLRATPSAYTPLLRTATYVMMIAYLASSAGWKQAWSPYTAAWYRYLFLTFLGWPNYLLRNAWFVPVPVMGLAHFLGLPGLTWLERFIRARAPRRDRAAGFAAAVGYDVLMGQGRAGDARDWLDRLLPVLQAGGIWPMEAAAADLSLLGYSHECQEVRLAEAGMDLDPTRLPLAAANNIAWALLMAGRAADALPYARAAINTAAPKPAHLDTAGRVLFETGALAEGEAILRQALRWENDLGTRVALARTLAAQGRFAEAVGEARRALDQQRGPWPADEPSTGQVELWIAEWNAVANA